MGFGKSKAKMMNELKGKVTFNDVAGVEEAKEEVLISPRNFGRADPRSRPASRRAWTMTLHVFG